MEENYEINEEASVALNRYKRMLENNASYYFDIFEFEYIIDFYVDKHEYEVAYDVAKYGLQIHPGATSILLKKAQLLINKNHHYKALKILKDLVFLDASNSSVFLYSGIVYTSLGEINKALKYFDKALSLEYEDKVELLLNIASSLQQIGHYGFALKYYEQAYLQENDNSTVLFELAYCYEKLNKDKEAIKKYKEYITFDPFSKLAWYNLGNIYHKIEKYERAIEAMDYALAITPEYHHALYQKALNQVYNEDYELGIDTFNEYLKTENDSASAHFHIGEAYAKLNENKKALASFKQTIELDDMYADAFYGQAYILYTLKRYTDAYYSIKKAIKLDHEDADFWHLSALVNQELGFFNESEKSFKAALDLENTDPQIWIDYSSLQKGNKNLVKRISILSEAFERFNDNAEINYRLAANLALVSNVDSAVYHLKKALKTEPSKLDIFRSIYTVKNSVIEDLIQKFRFGKFDFKYKS